MEDAGSLEDMGLRQGGPTLLLGDNTTAVDLTHYQITRNGTKHIKAKYFWLRYVVMNTRELIVKWIETELMVADVMTKAFARVPHEQLRGWVLGEKAFDISTAKRRIKR